MKVRSCFLCGADTRLPYTCRTCWTAIPQEIKIAYYERLSEQSTCKHSQAWLRKELGFVR